MARYLKRFLLFVSILLFYFTTNIVVNYYYTKTIIPDEKSLNYLILGDSHMQNSIDTKFLNNSENYAKSGEPYCISFWKLKHILIEQEVSVDTLLLGFGHHNLSASVDKTFSSKAAEMNFVRSYAIHTYSEKDSITVDFYKYYNVLFRKLAFYPKKNHYHYQGKFSALKKVLTKRSFYKTPFLKHKHFYNNQKELGFANENIRYLDSIVALCIKNRVKLYLVGTPVSNKYFKNIPQQFIDHYTKTKKKYSNKGVDILDYSNLKLLDSLFCDFDHLNIIGVDHFMNKIDSVLTK